MYSKFRKADKKKQHLKFSFSEKDWSIAYRKVGLCHGHFPENLYTIDVNKAKGFCLISCYFLSTVCVNELLCNSSIL